MIASIIIHEDDAGWRRRLTSKDRPLTIRLIKGHDCHHDPKKEPIKYSSEEFCRGKRIIGKKNFDGIVLCIQIPRKDLSPSFFGWPCTCLCLHVRFVVGPISRSGLCHLKRSFERVCRLENRITVCPSTLDRSEKEGKRDFLHPHI